MLKPILKRFSTQRQRFFIANHVNRLLSLLSPSYEREYLRPSFSAWGEDRIIDAWLTIKGVQPSDVRYLDVGAAYPVFLSNTYLFYRGGGRGVLVEPDPSLGATLSTVRSRDILLPVGATHTSERKASLIKMTSPVFNTFVPSSAAKAVEQSKSWAEYQKQEITGRIEVSLVSMNEILEKHFSHGELHVLSIDVEGMDFQLLESIDFAQYQPWAICAEAAVPRERFLEVLAPHGYSLVAVTPDNYIFFRV